MTTIDVYSFKSSWEIPSPSPFCLKLETWLRLANIPYTQKTPNGPPRSKTGKMPYAEIDGDHLYDSSKIIDHIRGIIDVSIDDALSPKQLATAHTVQRTFEEHFYWAVVYQRWCIPANFIEVKRAYFGALPPVVRHLLPLFIRRKVARDARGHGMARHTWTDVLDRTKSDLQALTSLLGEGPYYFGEQPSTVDAISYAFIDNVVGVPIRDDLTTLVESFEPLVNHCHRIREIAWSDASSAE